MGELRKMRTTKRLEKVFIFIILMAQEMSGHLAQLRCFTNVGHTPKWVTLMKNTSVITLPVFEESAIGCANLCEKQGCQSFAYNSVTRQCFIQNINVGITGLLCGRAVDEAREKCQVHGDSYIAYGGKRQTPLECICGVNRAFDTPIWVIFPDVTPYYCIDTCTGPICDAKLGYGEPCVSCNGGTSDCHPSLMLSYPVAMSVCWKAF